MKHLRPASVATAPLPGARRTWPVRGDVIAAVFTTAAETVVFDVLRVDLVDPTVGRIVADRSIEVCADCARMLHADAYRLLPRRVAARPARVLIWMRLDLRDEEAMA